MARIIFSGNLVGLVVRGKNSDAHSPGLMSQHADCILSSGAPIGFFGGGGAGSSDSSGSSSRSSGSSGLNMKGEVFGPDEFKKHRPFYIDGKKAKTAGMLSTVLTIAVSDTQAAAFDKAWADYAKKPPSFWLLGANCSTRAAGVFKKAGILSGGIPGLDTPNNLYKQLKKTCGKNATSYSGYVGFEVWNAGYAVTVD